MENKIIDELLKLTDKAYKKNESPVAAIIIKNNKIIAKAYNKRNKSNLIYAHAEILAIVKACKKVGDWRLNDCVMYTTLEPCEMCTSFIKESRIKKVYYLVKKDYRKKQYSKTIFQQLSNNQTNVLAKKLNLFWKNKR